MLSFKSSLSFVAGCFTEAFVGGAELVACVAVTGYEIVAVGVAEGVEVARETYDADMEAAVVAATPVAEATVQAVVDQYMGVRFGGAHEAHYNEGAAARKAAAEARKAATVAVEAYRAAVAAGSPDEEVDALYLAGVAAEEAAYAAEDACDAVAQQAVVAPVAVPVAAVGIIARTKAVLHAAWVGVGAGVRASYEVAPVLWKDHYGTVVAHHDVRVAARKVAPVVVAPVTAAVVNEEAAVYTTATVDVNDLTVEARVATAFAIFGMVLTRMIRTVVRVAWSIVKVMVRIITFPIRKLFTITRRTRTAA